LFGWRIQPESASHNSIFLSHEISQQFSQQYFSLTRNQPASQPASQPNKPILFAALAKTACAVTLEISIKYWKD